MADGVSILICTHGDDRWEELSWSRAFPSTLGQAHDPQVLVVHRQDMTLAQVRNLAATRAKKPWLCFLDADDELAPDYVRAMHDAMDTGTLLAPAVDYVGRPRTGPPQIPNAGRWPDLNECVIGTLVERSLFEQVGGFREMTSLEDYDLWLRCVTAGTRIVHVPGAVYRAHTSTHGRNRDQTIYPRLREEHAAVWECSR